MNLDDINKIERETGLKFPKSYIDVVTNYPDDLLETDAPDFGLLDNPEDIIDENNSVRENDYFGEKWPERYLIIGKNGCGDYYVTTPESEGFSIGFSDHEKMECNLYAKSLNEFIEKFLNEQ